MNTTEINNRLTAEPDWVNVVLGIWLILSPFVLGFTKHAALWNNVCVGVAVMAVALVSGVGNGALPGLLVLLGAWVFISPFLLGFSRTAFLWTNVGTAFLVITGAAISEALRIMHSVARSPHT